MEKGTEEHNGREVIDRKLNEERKEGNKKRDRKK